MPDETDWDAIRSALSKIDEGRAQLVAAAAVGDTSGESLPPIGPRVRGNEFWRHVAIVAFSASMIAVALPTLHRWVYSPPASRTTFNTDLYSAESALPYRAEREDRLRSLERDIESLRREIELQKSAINLLEAFVDQSSPTSFTHPMVLGDEFPSETPLGIPVPPIQAPENLDDADGGQP